MMFQHSYNFHTPFVLLSVSDINECVQANICGNGTCVNVQGTFQCNCGPGFAPGHDGICEGLGDVLCGAELNN